MPQTGLMMNRPLLISGILEHGAAQFGDQEIVSRETHGPLHRTTYAETGNGAIPTTPAKDYRAIMICHFIQGNAGTIPNSFKRKGWK